MIYRLDNPWSVLIKRCKIFQQHYLTENLSHCFSRGDFDGIRYRKYANLGTLSFCRFNIYISNLIE